MQRGTRVGQAYIAITADGSGINDDIADAFDDIDYKEIGDEHGRQYASRIREHLNGLDKDFEGMTDRLGNRLSSRLSKAIESDNTLSQGVSKMLASAFDDGKLDELVQHVGRRAGVTFGGEFDKTVTREVLNSLEGSLNKAVRSGDLDLSSLIRGIDSGGGQIDIFGPVLDQAVRAVEKAHREMEADTERSINLRARQEQMGERIVAGMREKYAKDYAALLDKQDKDNDTRNRMLATAYRMNAKFDDDRLKMLAKAYDLNKKFDEARMKMLAKAHALNQKYDDDRMKVLESAYRANKKFDEARNKMLETAYRLNQKYDDDRNKMLAKAYDLNKKFDDDRIRMIELAHRLNAKYDAEKMSALQRMGVLQERALKLNEQFNLGKIDGRGDRVSGNRDTDVDFGSKIGKMFGANSRNNFLNVFGKSLGGIVSLVGKGATLASTFATNMERAGQGATLIQRVMAGFGGGGGGATMFARLGAMAPMAVAAIATVVVALSVMASAVGALLALVVSLVATIASALVGALAVAGPALGAFAVAAGLVTAAFTSMTNAQREYLQNAFQPVKAAMTGIGQIIMTQFTKPLYEGRSAIQVWSANIQQAMLPLAGVAKASARAFADAGNTITAALSGPGFQRFFTSLGSELPTIVRRLSSALGGFMNGIAGMFAAIMPYVTQFAKYLDGVATSFSAWANSAKGQNSISDFVGRAIESLKSLWGAVKQIGGFIADVFFSPQAQKAGNSIFDSIAGAFEKFRRAFNKAARNGDLERWFNDGIKFGSALWSVVTALADTFFALYNSGVLTAVAGGFQALAFMFDAANLVLRPLIDALGYVLPGVLAVAITPIVTLAAALLSLGEVVEWLGGLVGIGNGSEGITKPFSDAFSLLNGMASYTPQQTRPGGGFIGPIAPGLPGNMMGGYQLPQMDLGNLVSSGNTALNNTYEQYGGYMPDPTDPTKKDKKKYGLKRDDWTNPYVDFANSLIAQGPTIADEIRKAARQAHKVIKDALAEVTQMFTDLLSDTYQSMLDGVSAATTSLDYTAVVSSFESIINNASEAAANAVVTAGERGQALIDGAIATRDQMVATAQAAVDSAARDLANAKTPEQARAALKALHKAQKDLDLAYNQGAQLIADARRTAAQMGDAAGAAMDRVANANAILAGQAIVTPENVLNLLMGIDVANATLADYAAARSAVANSLAEANQKLSDAIAMRDNYNVQVADSIKSFGSLLSAQAKTINGVQQALTSDDITTSMRERLEKVKKFQETLRQLLALGLSDSAYKQLVDAGAEQGGAYADAILAGGQGAISEVNDLTAGFDAAGATLGEAASSHLYQAGVDAAQGLVDGLLSLSDQLDSAAARLGEAITAAIKRELGIASPSRVLRAMMGDAGDGVVLGLDDQHDKVGAAAANLSAALTNQIAVSPEVAAYAQSQRPRVETTGDTFAEVSGNADGTEFAGRIRDLHVHTPTEDPMAVANEVLNEVTARL